jgi:hypothetical protein
MPNSRQHDQYVACKVAVPTMYMACAALNKIGVTGVK